MLKCILDAIYIWYANAIHIKYYPFVHFVNIYHNFIWGNSPKEKP